MAEVPLSLTDWPRTFAGLTPAMVKNRFFEQNPSQVKGVAALARPATSRIGAYGSGPIRSFYSLSGLHAGALFFVSGTSLYRRDTDGETFQIGGTVFGDGAVAMTGVKGPGYEYLFIADGSHLQVYQGGTHATATLTAVGQPSEGDVILINTTSYQWTATTAPGGEMEDGSGTAADPWKVKIGADTTASLQNMADAINFVGSPGDIWSPNLGGQNGDVSASDVGTGTALVVTARTDLAVANTYPTTVTYGDATHNISWGDVTMVGGGTHGLNGVEIPDGQPPVDVTTLKGFVLVAIGDNDRFYWLNPGTVVIDALDFATAESHPDELVAIEAVGDTVWLIGNSSSEVWYATGSLDAPFAPVSGRAYPFGAVAGTVVNIRDTVYLVGNDDVVYAMGGIPQRVSNHGVEETIRLALVGE